MSVSVSMYLAQFRAAHALLAGSALAILPLATSAVAGDCPAPLFAPNLLSGAGDGAEWVAIGDLDGDGTTNGADLGILLGAWS